MPPTFRDFVDKLRLTADILEVVGRHVELKKAGSRWKGLCPFHNEKTPSFVVSPDRQSYYCFGCHEHGDAIGFVAKIENLDWREAAVQLGKRYGLEPPRRTSAAEDEKARKFHEALLAANAMAQAFFAQQLAHSRAARDYLAEREIDAQTAERFGLGLAPDAWDNLSRQGRQKGFSEEILLAAGLLIHNEDKNRTYDRFRARIMFPIADSVGRPIAFGGRIFGPQAAGTDMAKYINSPETPLYKKGQHLYAFHLARDTIRERKCAIVLEGYTDVIALHQHGFTHAVASLGTALTPEQARLLRRVCREVIFLYDDDEAGRTAMLRGTEILLAQEFTVRCVGLKEGEDPDSFLRRDGADAFAERLRQAKPFFEHFLNQALHRFNKSTVAGRTGAVEMLGGLIKATPNAIEADEYVQHLAETLSLSADVVRAHLKIGRGSQAPARSAKPAPTIAESVERSQAPHAAEKALLRILVDHADLAAKFERFKLAWIENVAIRRLAEMVVDASGRALTWQQLMDQAEEPEQRLLHELAAMEEAIANPALMLEQACRRLEIRHRRQKARSLSKSLECLDLASSLEETDSRLREIHQLHRQRHQADQEIRRLGEAEQPPPND